MKVILFTLITTFAVQSMAQVVVPPDSFLNSKAVHKFDDLTTEAKLNLLKAHEASVRESIVALKKIEKYKTPGVVVGVGLFSLGLVQFSAGALALWETRFGQTLIARSTNGVIEFVTRKGSKVATVAEAAVQDGAALAAAPIKFDEKLSMVTGAVLMPMGLGTGITWFYLHDYALEGFVQALRESQALLDAQILKAQADAKYNH